MNWAYLLHFDTPVAHAKHYLGATSDLWTRLWDHAAGHAAALTAHLETEGIEWHVSRLWLLDDAFHLERHLKRTNNSPYYCPVCNPPFGGSILGLDDHPLELIPFPLDSERIRQCTRTLKK